MSALSDNLQTLLGTILYTKSEDKTNHDTYYNNNVIHSNGIFMLLGKKLYSNINEYTVSTTSVSNNVGRRHFVTLLNTTDDVYIKCNYKLNSVGEWSYGGLGFCSSAPTTDTTTSTTNGGSIVIGLGFSNGGNNTSSYPTYHRLRTLKGTVTYDLVYGRYYQFELMRKGTNYICRVTDTSTNTIIYQGSTTITTSLPYIVLYSFEGCNYSYKDVVIKKL